MKHMIELIGHDLTKIFNVDWTQCSMGEPVGPGLKLGYEGWGDPDIALDPGLPLDMCMERLGLKKKFDYIDSRFFLNHVHGDCTLTHAGRGLMGLMSDSAILRITCLDTVMLAKDSIELIEKRSFIGGQILEKFLFCPAKDDSGRVFQQNFMTHFRVKMILPIEGEDKKIAVSPEIFVPDDVRLENISDAQWEIGDEANDLVEGLSHDWPKCISCGRLATKIDENRAFYSRYCKNHYAEARTFCDEEIISAYSFVIDFHKKK